MTQNLPTSPDELNTAFQQLLTIGTPWLFKTLGALVILVLGLIVASWLKRAVVKLMDRTDKIDPMLTSFLSSFTYYAALAFVVTLVLGNFGVQTTSLAALLGAAGLAIGLALQGTLAHVAAGVMILAFRPFNIGDYVIAAGEEGTVRYITLFTTEIATSDNKQIIIPNGKVWDQTITNFSAHKTRRLDMVFGIAYEDNIDTAMDVLHKLIAAEPHIHPSPNPVVAVAALGEHAVTLTARVWLDGSNYTAVKWAMNKAVKESFSAAGLTIPYPTALHYQRKAD